MGGLRLSPHYPILPEYLTSTLHRFLDTERVHTGEQARAEVWFVSLEAYPHTLWEGRVVEVAEASSIIGAATILKVSNPLLLKPADKPA